MRFERLIHSACADFAPRKLLFVRSGSHGRNERSLNIADRVLKYGCGITQEEAEKDHDENLHNFLLRMQQVELELNPAR